MIFQFFGIKSTISAYTINKHLFYVRILEAENNLFSFIIICMQEYSVCFEQTVVILHQK